MMELETACNQPGQLAIRSVRAAGGFFSVKYGNFNSIMDQGHFGWSGAEVNVGNLNK